MLGAGVPFVELGAGLLLAAGLWIRPTLVVLGFHLLMITYGHLLVEPFFDVTTHVLPRMLLVLVLLALGSGRDRWSLDAMLGRRINSPGDPR